jgi:hypothetical protein
MVTTETKATNGTKDSTTRTVTTEGDYRVKTDRKTAIFVGIMFILASASAILGLLFYSPILNGPDYLTNGAQNSTQVILGGLMELVTAVTAIGTAVGLFPVLRAYGERIALGHLLFRFFEAVAIAVGVVAMLSLLTLSQEYVAVGGATSAGTAAYHASGSLLHAVYKSTFMLGPLFLLGINTFLYSSLLYKSRLVPRPLAVMGLTGATLCLVYSMLVMFRVTAQGEAPFVLLVLPIAVYEMILAGWLIAKGFNRAAVTARSAQIQGNEAFSPA